MLVSCLRLCSASRIFSSVSSSGDLFCCENVCGDVESKLYHSTYTWNVITLLLEYQRCISINIIMHIISSLLSTCKIRLYITAPFLSLILCMHLVLKPLVKRPDH